MKEIFVLNNGLACNSSSFSVGSIAGENIRFNNFVFI